MTELTRMTAQHLKRISEIERECFSDPWSERAFADILSDENELARGALRCYVILRGDIVAGYICVSSVLDEAEIVNVAVSPDSRRMGIGGALLRGVVGMYTAEGFTRFDLEVRESNSPARALYEAQGFEYIGRRRGFYTKPVEDALLMCKIVK